MLIFEDMVNSFSKDINGKGKSLDLSVGSILNSVEVTPTGDILSGSAVNRISAVVSKEVSYYANNVNNVIKDYKERVASDISKFSQKNPLSEFKLDFISIPNFISLLKTNGSFDYLTGEERIPLDSVNVSFKEKNNDEIMEILTEAYPVNADDIKKFFKDCGKDFLENVWNKYMLNVTPNNEAWNSLNGNSIKYSTELYALFLIFKVATDRVLDSRASISNYKNTTDIIFKRLKAKLSHVKEDYDLYERQDRIILAYEGTKVTLHSGCYDTFIKNGNDVELIIAATKHSDFKSSQITGERIVKNKEILKSSWKDYINFTSHRLKLEESDKIRKSYSLNISLIYSALLEEDKNKIGITDAGELETIVNGVVSSLKDEELYNLDNARKVLTSTLYINTNADLFFNKCDDYSHMDNNYGAKDIATLATIDLIVEFVISGIEVN